jgi:hypothetical protein
MRYICVFALSAYVVLEPLVAQAQQSASQSVTVQYKMPTGAEEGYDEASIDLRYGFAICAGEVKLWYQLATDRPKVGQWYRFKGESHLVTHTAPKVSTVELQVSITASGKPLRTAPIEPSSHGGGICTSINTTLGTVKQLIGEKPKPEEIQLYLDGLSLSASRIQRPLYSTIVDAELRRKEQDAKERQRKEDERRQKEADDKKKLEDDKKKQDQAEQARIAEENTRREEELRRQQEQADAARAAEQTKAQTDNGTSTDASKGGDATTATEDAAPGGQPFETPTAKGPTAAERIATYEKAREDKKAADAEEDKKRRAHTEWTEADEHDTGYWPESRCMYFDSDGVISPPRGKHRCDPKFMKYVFETRAKQLAEDQERLQREKRDKAFKKMLRGDSGTRASTNTSAKGSSALSGIGTAASGLAAATTSASSGSSSSPDRFPGGPSVVMPFLVLLEGSLFGVLAYGGMTKGLSPELAKKVDARAKDMAVVIEYRCEQGDDEACDEQDMWKRASNPAVRAKLPWTTNALLGPGVGYSFSLGYVREDRAGAADPRSTASFNGTLHGLSVDLAWRMRLLRANLGYYHLRGNLFDQRSDDLAYTSAQGLNALSVGLAIQPGWSQLISPYLGIRHRIDIQSGDFSDEFDGMDTREEGRVRNLGGGRTFGTLGVSIAAPPSFEHAMFKSWILNLELYSDDASNITGGFMVTLGRQVWAPAWITELPGVSTAESPTKQHTWVLPYIFTEGAGLKVATFDRRRLRVSVLDVWLGPGSEGRGLDTAGITVGEVGPMFRLPGFDHAVSLTMGLGLNCWTRDEVITVSPTQPVGEQPLPQRQERVRVFGLGAATLAYRAKVRNYTLEAGLRFPLAWWEERVRNSLTSERSPSFFAGPPPGLAYLGFGY